MATIRIATAATAFALVLFHSAAFAQLDPTGRAPTQRDVDTCNREAELSGGSASPGAPTGGATSAAGATGDTGTLHGGSTLSNATTLGVPPDRSDSGYQQVYRDCMRRLGYGE